MHRFLDVSLISVVMPILLAIIVLVIAVMLIVVYGKTKQMQIAAIDKQSFEQLAEELKADNAAIRSELADIKETLSSINKMMKDIE